MCSMTKAAERIATVLAEVEQPDAALGDAAAVDFLELDALVQRLLALRLRRLSVLDAAGVAGSDGSVGTAGWLRRNTRCSARAAHGDVRLARRLHTDTDRPLTTTRTLLEQGRLTVEHAQVIARATALLDPEPCAVAEPIIAEEAARHAVDPARDIATAAARRAQEHHLRDQDDPAEARRQHALAERHLDLAPCGDLWAISGLLSPEAGQALKAVLGPLTAPGRNARGADGTSAGASGTGSTGTGSTGTGSTGTGSTGTGSTDVGSSDVVSSGDVAAVAGQPVPDERTATQRRADAFGEAMTLLLTAGRLPVHGGHRPHVQVVVDLADLQSGSPTGTYADGTGTYADGSELTRGETARILCDARIGWLAVDTTTDAAADAVADTAVTGGGPPGGTGSGLAEAGHEVDVVVRRAIHRALTRVSPALGGLARQVLDAGGSSRLVTPAQRQALAVRDRGCIFPGCDRPPEWCDAHHLVPWEEGGPTDLLNLGLLCTPHHGAVHHDWTLVRLPDGTVRVTPRHPPGAPRPRAERPVAA